MATFRSVPETDRRRYREILRYAFAPQSGPVTDDVDGGWPPELFDPCGLYADGELVSTCKRYTLDAWLRDGYEPIGGLGAVATPPEHRRRGFVRTLCRHALDAFEADGARLVALWPFETAYYAQFGWASAHEIRRYDCPPDALPRHDVAGQMRPLGVDDWERLRPAEATHSKGLALSLRRSERWWRERTLTNWTGGTQPYIYGYERDGEIVGYLTYTVADDETETLTVGTLAAADEDAFRAILTFLGSHGAQIERIVFEQPTGSDLLARVEEPERIDCTVKPGPMVRTPSVDALDGLPVSANALDCTLAVSDPLATPDATTWRLRTRDGKVRVDAAEIETAEADLALGIGTLSQFVVGTRSVEAARRLDDLTVRKEEAANALGTAFPEQRVFLGEFF